jgi:membrane protease YdiL (CAAX protease family)
MESQSGQMGRAIETLIVFVAWIYFAMLTAALAAAAGVKLPDMPVLHHTYLDFVFVLLLLLWLKLRGDPWTSLGLIPFKARYLAFGLALALGSIVLDSVVRSVSTPLLISWFGAQDHLPEKTFAAVKGNLPLYLMLVPSIWLFAAFGEEVVFRGYLLTRFGQILGGGRLAIAVAVVAQGLFFGAAHTYQGPIGMVPIAVGAMLSGIVSVAWGRNLWPAMIAHGLVDTLGFTMLYLGIPLS